MKDLKAVAEYLTDNEAQITALIIRLCEINSGSLNVQGLHRVADLLKKEFSVLNCQQTIMPMAPIQQVNARGAILDLPIGPVLRCWKRPQAPLQVLLIGHMDTVFGPEQRFKAVKRLSPDILNDPGVADMKGGLAVMLWGLKAFEQLPQAENLGWELILNSDEELGSPSSAEIIEARAKNFDLGLVFEPSINDKGSLAKERKGIGTFTMVMHGKSVHAGRNFTYGRNAICKMAEVVVKIHALNNQRAGVTINVGRIQGGGAVNVVADTCVCTIDVRVPNNLDADWVRNNLYEIVSSVNAENDFRLELSGKFFRKPKIITDRIEHLYEIIRLAGKDLGQEIDWQASGGSCDGNNLAAVGLPNIDTLGVRGGNLHNADEYLIVPSVVERAQLLTHVLARLSDNGFK